MANLRNEFEFRSALLTALGQEHTEAEAKNEEMWRRKMLDGLGVEYDQNDVNQFGLFREKLIEGVTKKSEGGGSSWQTVFEGSVTTESESTFATGDIVGLESLNGDSVKVTFNGAEYTLPKHELGYGEMGNGNIPDFTNYPLFIETTDTPYLLYTQTAGTYTLKIEEPQSGGGGSSDFSTAEVTFSGTFLGEISWSNCPTLFDNMLAGSLYIDSLPTTIIVPLYKGKCVWEHGTLDLTLSGNIEPYYDGMLITGDCAIVIDI